MAKIHQIDGATIEYVNKADWIDRVEDQSLDVHTVFNRFQRHRWQMDVMPMREWETIVDLEGTYVDLTTTDPDDRNADYVTYYGARVDRVSGNHPARHIEGGVIDFLVRV